MSTIINGTSDAITFPDSTIQNTAALPLTGGTVTGNVTVNGHIIQGATTAPAFSVYRNGTQNVTASTFTKIQLNAETFDTNSNFDSTTNYRFTPTVAGYYFLQGSMIFQQVSGTGSVALAAIYKNGSNISQNELTATYSSGLTLQTSILVYMNGTTDYVELYGYTNAASTPSIADGANTTWFNGYLARSA